MEFLNLLYVNSLLGTRLFRRLKVRVYKIDPDGFGDFRVFCDRQNSGCRVNSVSKDI